MMLLAIGAALGLAACRPDAHSHEQVQAIAWREGDVQDALSEARQAHKPVLLYWGAKWCPPCNLLKSTLFKDSAFIAETRDFVPVYLDGDTAGAQRWGERFGTSGYPTVIVLRPDGAEITRLSNGVTAADLTRVLQDAAGRTTSIEALFAKAQKDPSSLQPDEWRLLAAFDWQNDPRHFSDPGRAGALLGRLAQAAPDTRLQRRFALLALAVEAQKGPDGKYALTPAQQAWMEQALPVVLADPSEVTESRQELSYSIPSLVAALPDPARRQAIGASLIRALDGVYRDQSLPLADRLATTYADLALASANGATVPPDVLAKVRARAAWADGAAKDKMVRQSVISAAADLLHEAGDDKGSKRMLEAELTRSASPYYYMLDLAEIAEDEKDGPAAIAWARKAYEAAEGPATRVQWAIEYSETVLRQTPDDRAAVQASAQAAIDELGKTPGSYYQRTRVKVARWGGHLRKWSQAHDGGAVLAGLDAKMQGVCAKQGAQQSDCRRWTEAA
jgi:protein disulfide-isomerase